MLGSILLLVVAGSGCENDNDCKGDRICENHLCVSPPPATSLVPGSVDPLSVTPPAEPSPPPVVAAPAQQPSISPVKRKAPKATPAPEIGIMVTQSLVGALTAGAVTVLPYFVLFGSGAFGDPTLASMLFVLTFSISPIAVAGVQTWLGLASRNYRPSAWLPILVGLVGQGAVLGLYYATGWLPTWQASGGVPSGGSVALLMVGTIAVVPLLEMVAINLFKERRPRALVALDDAARRAGVVLSPPALVPMLAPSPAGMVWGIQFSPVRGQF